jgi:hypothetical protein
VSRACIMGTYKGKRSATGKSIGYEPDLMRGHGNPENASRSLARLTSNFAPCPDLIRAAKEQFAEAPGVSPRANPSAALRTSLDKHAAPRELGHPLPTALNTKGA